MVQLFVAGKYEYMRVREGYLVHWQINNKGQVSGGLCSSSRKAPLNVAGMREHEGGRMGRKQAI